MRPRTTLILVALALLAWAAWVFWLRPAPSVEERRASAASALPGFDAAKIDRITIEGPDRTIVLAKSGPHWRLSKPTLDLAQQTTVDQLLRDLAGAKALARIPAAEIQGGAEAAGLARGTTHVLLEGAGERCSLTIGASEIPGRRRYIRIDGAADLVLVDDSLAQSLARPLDEFREHDLFQLSPIDVTRWEVEQAGRPPVVFERRESDNWWIIAPLVDAADNLLVGGALSRVLSLRADHFLERLSAAPDLGFDPPAAVVRLFGPKGQATGVLTLGREIENGKRYGRVDSRPGDFEVFAGELLHELSRSPADFRSKLAMDAPVYEIAEVELARGAGGVTLRKASSSATAGESAWEVKSPAGFPLDPKKAEDVVTRLSHIEARRLADDVTAQAAGLANPSARLTIVGQDAKRLPRAVLEVGGPAGAGEVYARRAGRDAILVIDEKTAADIDPAAVKR